MYFIYLFIIDKLILFGYFKILLKNIFLINLSPLKYFNFPTEFVRILKIVKNKIERQY